MMTDQELSEATVLEKFLPSLEARGYRVVVQPPAASLPAFFKGHRPDAVAFKDGGNIVFEVVRKNTVASSKISRIRNLLQGQVDWRLQVVYTGELEKPVSVVDIQSVEMAIGSIKHITDKRAAFILAWSTLEAIVRVLHPDEAAKPQSPARVVELLASHGQILPTQADWLRRAARTRNGLVHGDLTISVSNGEVETFALMLESLAVLLHART